MKEKTKVMNPVFDAIKSADRFLENGSYTQTDFGVFLPRFLECANKSPEEIGKELSWFAVKHLLPLSVFSENDPREIQYSITKMELGELDEYDAVYRQIHDTLHLWWKCKEDIYALLENSIEKTPFNEPVTGLNKDVETRDKIIFGSYDGASFKRFRGLTKKKLEKLIANNFIDATEKQNAAPTAGEFLEFMQAHKGFTAHGFAVGLSRDDYGIVIEGIEKRSNVTCEDTLDFRNAFSDASEYCCYSRHAFCWYD